MRIAIVTKNPFPIGMAATNRVISYAKELVTMGHSVKIFCLKPTEKKTKSIRNNKIKGKYHGISFVYTARTTIWPEHGKKKIYKLYLLLKGLINFIKTFIIENKKKKYDIIFLQIFDIISCKLIIRVAQLLKIKIVSERSEFHDVRFNKFKNNKKYRESYIKNVFKQFDGMILMTKSLQIYYEKFTNKHCKTIIVPMTVDLDRFDLAEKHNNSHDNYIAYCGNLNSKKDGVDILIEAYSEFNKKFPNIKLTLIGSGSEESISYYKKLTQELHIKDYVNFEGYIETNEIPKYLLNAKALVLARPSSRQALGGFPTKLGEYLASANPVVVTKVGEIPNYLEDNKSAFLAEPDSIKSIEKKLLQVFKNYNKALQVGHNGRNVVETVFNGRIQAKRIENFLESI